MGTVTLSMIVKNEEKHLDECLSSVKNVVDEIVIVDTGSSDDTVNIARNHDADVYDFEWIDDFSAARNYALSKSTCDWILYLDADERLTPDSADVINQLKQKKELFGVKCSVISEEEHRSRSNVMKYIRFFRNHPEIRFIGRIHEQIEPALLNKGYSIVDSDIKIEHTGYNITEEDITKKAERNLKLLLKDYEDNRNAYISFQIGQTYVTMGEIEKAVPYLEECVKDLNLEKNHSAHAYRFLSAYELDFANNPRKAETFVNKGLSLVPGQPLLNVIASKVYLQLEDLDKAKSYAEKAYNFNKQLHQRGTSEFDILVDENDLLNHLLQTAVIVYDKELFNKYFSHEVNKNNETSWSSILSLFNNLYNNNEVSISDVEKINEDRAIAYMPFILKALSGYQLHGIKHSLLQYFKKLVSTSVEVRVMLAQYYLDKSDVEKAIMELREGLDVNPHPVLMNNLIVIYNELNNYKELYEVLNKYTDAFNDYPDVKEKLNLLKEKLKNMV